GGVGEVGAGVRRQDAAVGRGGGPVPVAVRVVLGEVLVGRDVALGRDLLDQLPEAVVLAHGDDGLEAVAEGALGGAPLVVAQRLVDQVAGRLDVPLQPVLVGAGGQHRAAPHPAGPGAGPGGGRLAGRL